MKFAKGKKVTPPAEKAQAEAEKVSIGVKGHVFFSYSRAFESPVRKVKTFMESNGIHCWMCPCNNKQTKVFDSIAEAVENCSVFVAFYGLDYKNSPYCEEEMMRAVELRKVIIPVKMQKNYKADGWLGLKITRYRRLDLSENCENQGRLKELLDVITAEGEKIER